MPDPTDLSHRDTQGIIDSIKNEIIHTLTSADSDVRVFKTEYFNHTFAPDLVLRWPKDKSERRVYLRTTSDPSYLREDLDLMDEKSAIMMPIAAVSDAAEKERIEFLGGSSRANKSLVAGPRTFATLAESQHDQPVIGLASRALLQGGIGAVGATRAREFGSDLAEGFAAAQEGDAEETSGALIAANDLLDTTRAVEVTNFLRAVWVGSGASSGDFPDRNGGLDGLTPAALALLLDTVEIEDPGFWVRLGRGLTIDDLTGVDMPPDHTNFQRLVTATAYLLKVKACRVVEVPGGKTLDPRWFSSKGELGLRFGEVSILFTGGRIDSISEPGRSSLVAVSTFKRRARRSQIAVSEIAIKSFDESRLDYSVATGVTITEDERLDALEESMGEGAIVTSATVNVSGSPLLANMATSTAHGRTVSKFFLSQIAMNSVPLFLDLESSETARLAAVVGVADFEEH